MRYRVAVTAGYAAIRESLTRSLAFIVLSVLLGAAAYEAAVALEWIPVGTVPGENARFEWLVMVAAVVALVTGMVVSVVCAVRDRRSVPAALFPVAAAASMIARFYTFDTYYLPTLTRYSESGSFPSTWVYGVAIGGVVALFSSLVRPRFGFLIGAAVIFLCLFTMVFFGVGK